MLCRAKIVCDGSARVALDRFQVDKGVASREPFLRVYLRVSYARGRHRASALKNVS